MIVWGWILTELQKHALTEGDVEVGEGDEVFQKNFGGGHVENHFILDTRHVDLNREGIV